MGEGVYASGGELFGRNRARRLASGALSIWLLAACSDASKGITAEAALSEPADGSVLDGSTVFDAGSGPSTARPGDPGDAAALEPDAAPADSLADASLPTDSGPVGLADAGAEEPVMGTKPAGSPCLRDRECAVSNECRQGQCEQGVCVEAFRCDVPCGGDGVCFAGQCRDDGCANGLRQGDEGCDDANRKNGDGCDAQCEPEDGFVCSASTPSICVAKCGDGKIRGTEACDDGNLTGGDGCSPGCTREPGMNCVGEPSRCASGGTVCGNGVLSTPEQCDDGNTKRDDGCFDCRVELNFVCTLASPSVCTPKVICGNAQLDPGERCDDGNQADGDGCSHRCSREAGFLCEGPELGTCVLGCGFRL